MTWQERLKWLWGRISSLIAGFCRTIEILAGLLAIITTLGLSTVVIGYINNILSVILIGGVIFILCVFLIIYLYTRVFGERPKTPSPSNPDIPLAIRESAAGKFLVLKRIAQLEYLSDGQTIHACTYLKVRALQDNLNSYPSGYMPTGGPKKGVVCSLTPGYEIISQRMDEFRPEWNYFEVQFPSPLKKNQEVGFTTQIEIFDKEKTCEPLFGCSILIPTEYLLLTVKLPRDLKPKLAYCYEFTDPMGDLPKMAQEVRWDPVTCAVSYEVPQPQLNHRYLIRWWWDSDTKENS